MKKLFVTIAISATCVGAFAQGKVLFGNDPNHLVNMGTDPSHLKPADVPSAGLPAPFALVGGALPSGTTMVAGLYGGQNSGSLSLLTSVPISGASGFGRLTSLSYVLPTAAPGPFPGGVSAFFQVKIWETGYASYEASQAASLGNSALVSYGAQTLVFAGTPGGGVTYPALSGGSFSWLQAAAAWQGGGFSTFNVVPEPSSVVLAGLGAASLLMFRRKQ